MLQLNGGKIFFQFFQGNTFSGRLESIWEFVPQKGDIISFENSCLDSGWRNLCETNVFLCKGIRYELIHIKEMGTTLNGVNVIIELEPYE